MDRVWGRSSDHGGLLAPLVASDGRSRRGGGGDGSGGVGKFLDVRNAKHPSDVGESQPHRHSATDFD
jgi:hypothetical protein